MSEHTKGPWKADIRSGCVAIYPANESHSCLSGIEATAIHYQDGRGEQPESGYRPVTEEQVANAFLIAAAPQLLEACRLAAKQSFRDDEGRAAVYSCVAAIAAAEGREA